MKVAGQFRPPSPEQRGGVYKTTATAEGEIALLPPALLVKISVEGGVLPARIIFQEKGSGETCKNCCLVWHFNRKFADERKMNLCK